MDISSSEMRESILSIYKVLDKVSPVDFDCGELCGEVCCVYDRDNCDGEELALYLLPGEELVYEGSEEFELYYLDSSEVDFPHSWRGGIYLVRCVNPPKCDRCLRPIQCRTFPLIPHISKDNKFHLIFDESEFPYRCPIIRDNIRLNDDFIRETYKVWRVLVKNPLVFDLVDMDSRRRDNRGVDYEIVV